jgi:hypothetical protein
MGACPTCGGTGLRESLGSLPVPEHARKLIATAWELGGLPDYQHLKLRKWAHQCGFGGHFSTKSRLYSTTLALIRAARADFAAERSNARNHRPDNLNVQREWSFAGTDYTAPETEVTSWVRRWIEQNREIGRDELARLRAEEAEMRERAESDPAYWAAVDEP